MNRILQALGQGFRSDRYKELFLENYSKKDYAFPLMNFADINEELTYQENAKLFRTSLHIGQRKLFLTELRFLAENVPKDEETIVVYAGAAPSNHTGLLSALFPNIIFILVDPSPFFVKDAKPYMLHKDIPLDYEHAVEVLKKVSEINNRIFAINDYFTVPLAQAVKDVFGSVYFISDIRTANEGEYPTTLDIFWNLALQYNWIIAMQPKLSMLKFRHPFYQGNKDLFYTMAKKAPYKEAFELAKENGIDFIASYSEETLTYFDGVIHLQPWAPVVSTETRLITTGADIRNWDHVSHYKNKMFYYNNIARCFRLRENSNADRKLGFDHCNDCAMENEIWLLYSEKYRKIDVKKYVQKLSAVSKPLFSDESLHGRYFGQYETAYFLEKINEHNRVNRAIVQKSRLELMKEMQSAKRPSQRSERKQLYVVTNDPKEIVQAEERSAVFRSQELLDLYLSLIPTVPKGYYIMSGSSYHCDQYIHLNLVEYGYVYMSPMHIDRRKPILFVRQNRSLGNKRDASIYTIPCTVKNLLDIAPVRDTVLTKSNLYKQIDTTVPTVDWKQFRYRGGIHILKIDRMLAFAGNSNFIITSNEDWQRHKKMLEELERKARSTKDINRMQGAIVSEYISNPLLYKGKKCHFRPYLMVRSWDIPVLSPFAIIMTAALPYKNDDYQNRNIHDSHLGTTERMKLVKDERILKAVKEVCQPVLDVIAEYKLPPYPESKRGYHILAPDVLLDEDYNAFVLEVNTSPGQGDLTKKGIEAYEKAFSEWEFKYGILPSV